MNPTNTSTRMFLHSTAAIALTILLGTGCTTTPPVPPAPPIDLPVVQPVPVPPPPVVEPPTPLPPPPVEPATKIYKIKAGDSLSRIAVRHGVKLDELIKLNDIRDANKIREGMEIKLPANAVERKVEPKARKSKPAAAVPGANYTVVPGDSLWTIARAHDTTVKALKEANGLTGDTVRVGQKLLIPGAKPAAEPAPVPAPTEAPAPLAPPVPETDTTTNAVPAIPETPAELPPLPAL